MNKLLSYEGLVTLLKQLKKAFDKKQDTLISGENIKTINGKPIVGSGNITVKSTFNLQDADIKAEATSGTAADVQVITTTDGLTFYFTLPKGEKGDKGEAGREGETPISTRTVMVYKASSTRPNTPTGGYWYVNASTNVVDTPTGWSLTYTEDSGIPIWMSTNIFSSQTGEPMQEWSLPIQITGKEGKAGADSVDFEYIYMLTANSLKTPSTPTSEQVDDYVPSGWSDHPQGISETMQAEWVSTRNKTDDGWSDFSTPVLWSRWAVDGKDGDGVEYIYKRTTEGIAPDVPVAGTDYDIDSTNYQEDDYVPTGWTDNPTGVDSTYMFEWVAIRRYDHTTGKWGAFEGSSSNKAKAALWAKYGEKGDQGVTGYSIRTMYAKGDDSSTDLSGLLDKYNINPGSIWSLTIPNFTAPECIFAIQATVTYDNQLAYPEIGWQGPYILTGVQGKSGVVPNYKFYIYYLSDTKPEKPTWDTATLQDGWQDYPNNTGQWWQCIGTVDGATGFVTSWSEVIPVNGQDGTAQDGKKTEFRFALGTLTAPDIDVTKRTPDGWSMQPPTVTSGKYLWMTTAVINPDDTLNTNWTTPVRISGESGAGVTTVTEYYMISPSSDASTITVKGDAYGHTWSESLVSPNSEAKYLWNYEKTTYSDGSTMQTDFHIISMYMGDIKGIESVTNYYMVSTSYTGIVAGDKDGTGWETTPPTVGEGKYLWNYEVVVYTDGSYSITEARMIGSNIRGAAGAQGPAGEAGAAGVDGVDGVPGITTEVRYSIGTDTEPEASYTTPNLKKREPLGWSVGMPALTTDYKYMWCIQSRINYKAGDDPTDTSVGTLASGQWSQPIRLTGLNGLDGTGEQGKRGQLVYPAGVYSTSVSYTTDEDKAPYVLDTSTGKFYVLNKQMTWLGTEQSNLSPSQDTTGCWLEFDGYDAVYAKIGIIANGLIGSAVFNGDYMFSQQGIDASGSSTTNYENFNADDPYNKSNSFRPNWCVNLATGQMWTSAGKCVFNADGSGSLGNGALTWDSKGEYTIKFTDAIIDQLKNFGIATSTSVQEYVASASFKTLKIDESSTIADDGQIHIKASTDGTSYYQFVNVYANNSFRTICNDSTSAMTVIYSLPSTVPSALANTSNPYATLTCAALTCSATQITMPSGYALIQVAVQGTTAYVFMTPIGYVNLRTSSSSGGITIGSES